MVRLEKEKDCTILGPKSQVFSGSGTLDCDHHRPLLALFLSLERFVMDGVREFS